MLADETLASQDRHAPLSERSLSKLRWRCRHESRMTVGQARGMYALMDLSDNDLMDLLLRRKELQPEIGTDEVREVLDLLRS